MLTLVISSLLTQATYGRCNGRNDGCGRILDEGDGDCDRDSDCRGNLKCGRDNCGPYVGTTHGWPRDSNSGWDLTDDCCYNPNSTPTGECWTVPQHWTDTDGDDCRKYQRNGWCGKSWQSKYRRLDATADEACCECGGGNKLYNHPNCKLPNGQRMGRSLVIVGCNWHLCSTSGVVYSGKSSNCRRRSEDGITADAAPEFEEELPMGTRRQDAEIYDLPLHEADPEETSFLALAKKLESAYEKVAELQQIFDDAANELSTHLEAGSLEKTSSLQANEEEAERNLEEGIKIVRELEEQLKDLGAEDSVQLRRL